jgi:hypothetical protein
MRVGVAHSDEAPSTTTSTSPDLCQHRQVLVTAHMVVPCLDETQTIDPSSQAFHDTPTSDSNDATRDFALDLPQPPLVVAKLYAGGNDPSTR